MQRTCKKAITENVIVFFMDIIAPETIGMCGAEKRKR